MYWLQLGEAALNLVNGAEANKQAQEDGDNQAQQLEYEARYRRMIALEQAGLIRRAGREQVAETTAAYAGAGVDVTQGSPETVRNQQFVDIEHDATMAILNADRQANALEAQAKLAKITGQARGTALQQDAWGNALADAGKAYSGWKTAQSNKPKGG